MVKLRGVLRLFIRTYFKLTITDNILCHMSRRFLSYMIAAYLSHIAKLYFNADILNNCRLQSLTEQTCDIHNSNKTYVYHECKFNTRRKKSWHRNFSNGKSSKTKWQNQDSIIQTWVIRPQ